MKKKACGLCSREISLSNYNKHIEVCKGPVTKKVLGEWDPNIGYKNGTRQAWNKGLTKDVVPSLSRIGIKHSKPRTDETKAKLSKIAKDRGLGGYRPHPNKGSKYKNIWFDSNWEIQVAKSLDENNISWERPRIGFIWTDTGKKYYPDFYLPEYDVYLDPKNDYLIEKDKEKIEQSQLRNNIRVIVLRFDQLNWNNIKNLL